MTESLLYHEGSRQLQDEFGSRRLADREEETIARTALIDSDRAFIESARFFFLATADADGCPDCSFKGGLPGLVRVTAPDELAFPDYDGNGMFRSLGNIAVNPHVALLFISFEQPRRLRISGTAEIRRDDPLLPLTVGAQMIVRVKTRIIFPNCPRYIPTMTVVEDSTYAPRRGSDPVEPAWKSFPHFKDLVPPRRPTARGDEDVTLAVELLYLREDARAAGEEFLAFLIDLAAREAERVGTDLGSHRPRPRPRLVYAAREAEKPGG